MTGALVTTDSVSLLLVDMPTTFYLSFEILPGDEGLVDQRIEGAEANCWVVASDPASAAIKAIYQLQRTGWKIKSKVIPPVAVRLEDFKDKDLGEKAFLEAQEEGIAVFIVAHTPAKDLQTEAPVRQVFDKKEMDLSEFIEAQQSARSLGRCLYYSKTENCGTIIDAHSIQKNGALSVIARDGYVYSMSRKFTDIKKNKGRPVLVRTHVNSMSTFRGLCQYHDNLLFRPIDTVALQPSLEQVFLYAYRSLLRERFVKECAIEVCNNQLKSFHGTAATRGLLEGTRDGNILGLSNLETQQANFEKSHKDGNFSDIRYVMFRSSQAPTVVFSGLIFPDWGFNGELIQDLRARASDRGLMTFSFAPTDRGWAYLMAWHKVSDAACCYFISTLQAAIRSGKAVEDLLFGLVVKGCENAAYSSDWLKRRTTKELQDLEEAIAHGSDVLSLTAPNYLQTGIADIHDWKFDAVQDNLKKERGK